MIPAPPVTPILESPEPFVVRLAQRVDWFSVLCVVWAMAMPLALLVMTLGGN